MDNLRLFTLNESTIVTPHITNSIGTLFDNWSFSVFDTDTKIIIKLPPTRHEEALLVTPLEWKLLRMQLFHKYAISPRAIIQLQTLSGEDILAIPAE